MGPVRRRGGRAVIRTVSALVSISVAAGVVAQAPAPAEIPPTFALLNAVKSPSPIKVSIGGVSVGTGGVPFGFYSGIANWYPLAPISIEVEGMKSAEIKPDAKLKPGECPIYVAVDAKEEPPGGGLPVPVVKVLRVPPAAPRIASFVDVVNFTGKESLSLSVGKTDLSLDRGKRARISQGNGGGVMVLPDGPEVQVSPSEEGERSIVIIFYDDADGKTQYAVANDVVIRQ